MEKGKEHEHRLCSKLNNKKYCELEQPLKELLTSLFGKIESNSIIHSDICNRYSKPDIYIEINGITLFVSLKSGRSDSMHFENIRTFIKYLREMGVSEKTLKTVLLFHYGDGTLDGKGKTRYLLEELLPKMHGLIKEANLELSDRKIRESALERFVLKGVEGRMIKVDYLLFGQNNNYEYISSQELKTFIIKRRFLHINTLHIGPMTIQPFLRDVNRKSKNTYKREQI